MTDPRWFRELGSPWWVRVPLSTAHTTGSGGIVIAGFTGSPQRQTPQRPGLSQRFMSNRIILLGFQYTAKGTPVVELGWRDLDAPASSVGSVFHKDGRTDPAHSVPFCYIAGDQGAYSPATNQPHELVLGNTAATSGYITLWGIIEDGDTRAAFEADGSPFAVALPKPGGGGG